MPDLAEYRQLIRAAMTLLAADTKGLDIENILTTVTTAAVTLIRGAEWADVMLIDGGDFRCVAPTADFVTDLDAVQMRHKQGPCVEAAIDDAVVRGPNLTTEDRWPHFTQAAIRAGVHSVLTFQLSAPQHSAAALNLYGRAAGTFNVEDEAIGATLAAYATTVLLAESTRSELKSRLTDCETIGHATGILMERLHVDAAQARDILNQRAQDAGAPSLRSIADSIVATV
ncbi:ANTAR domain-containing protein [Mycobacterium sp. 236(2023)]|uniref:ANTAR domain-containing protein n=1 Tax=Mycobacterium sp. 236(2023) TaxID=3038163 RepID=UPI002414F54D|nr:ANTAR domain-containing protein [Mycobacterium sp. 236(2023)]MDG4667529.1 ANTAR domain-containing protein [Mycobacterium sp. 236(2023)]